MTASKEVAMRILLATDGSRAADQARDLVAALPWREGGRVRIVSVAPTRTDLLGVPWVVDVQPDADRIEDEALRVHRDALETAQREISSARLDVVIEPILVRGRAASAIVEEARSMPADLIVVGHRGHGRWESMLLGSVSSEVVDHAPCPVLVARDERLGPIVFADDGSPSARHAEAVLTSWPLFTGLPVTVLTVAEEHFPGGSALTPLLYPEAMAQYIESTHELEQSRRAENEAAAARLRSGGFHVTPLVRQGDPAHEIVAEARAREAGLIVVGTRGQSGLQRLILGSVARNVLLHAPCSVLIVRPASPPAEHNNPENESDLVAAGR
jgi:nucleotide-binding universal stress UspA family protein